MIYLIYSLISFILSITVLEREVRKSSRGLVGNALKRCNIFERLIFYIMPVVSEVYIVLLYIECKYPEQLPEIDWNNYPKHGVF